MDFANAILEYGITIATLGGLVLAVVALYKRIKDMQDKHDADRKERENKYIDTIDKFSHNTDMFTNTLVTMDNRLGNIETKVDKIESKVDEITKN